MMIINGESELTQLEMHDEQVTLENVELSWWHVTRAECRRHIWSNDDSGIFIVSNNAAINIEQSFITSIIYTTYLQSLQNNERQSHTIYIIITLRVIIIFFNYALFVISPL